MRTWFRKTIPVFAMFIASVVAGCTPNPEFTPPIRWEGTYREATFREVEIVVQLNQDGVGYVENLPIGMAQEGKYAGGCVADSTERYTGEIAWRSVSEYGVEISFPDSQYILGSGSGRFGTQDWSETWIGACGDERDYWSLNIVCGQTGIEYYDEGLPTC